MQGPIFRDNTVLEALKRIGIMFGGIAVLIAVVSGLQVLMMKRIPDVAAGIVVLAALFGAYYSYVRLTERRAVYELDPRALAPQLLLGLAIGTTLFVTVMGLLALTGHYRYVGRAAIPGLGTAFLLTTVGAVAEELIFRGFLFRVIASIGGTWIAVAISAVLFGVLHGFNPHATIVSSLAIALEAGGLLAFAYAATQKLWLPIGFHIAWNFTEGDIFGVAVSGHKPLPSLFVGHVSGPEYLTGGAFGAEASLFAVIVCVFAMAFIIAYTIRTNRLLPMIRR